MITDRVEIKTLPTQVVGKTIIIGDIHGCVNELDNLLQACNFQKEIDRIIHVGDLVNKGYDSRGVVQRMLELGAYGVVGNHDDTLLECIRDAKYFDQKDLKDPVKRTAKKFPSYLTDYLKNLPHIIRIPQYNLIVAHAGINPYLSLENQNPKDLTNMRRVMADGKAVHKGCMDGVAWAKVWSGPETVVFGHDAKAGLQIEEFALGLDTGCCYGDRLTAVVYPGKKLVHVPGAKPVVRTPKTHDGSDSQPVTPAYGAEGSTTFSEGLMTPSMVRTNSRPAMSGTPGRGNTPQTTPGTKSVGGGSSPPPQWPSQPLPGLVIGGGSVSAGRTTSTPPTVHPAGTTVAGLGGLTIGGGGGSSSNVAATTNDSFGNGGNGNGSSPADVTKLKKELNKTRLFTLKTIAASKQVQVLLALLQPGEVFDEVWYDLIQDESVPMGLWKDVLWCLAKGLSEPTTSEDDQERCLNLIQDVLLDREDVKEEVGFVLKTQLQNDQQAGIIKADKAFKSAMIALR